MNVLWWESEEIAEKRTDFSENEVKKEEKGVEVRRTRGKRRIEK